MMFALKNIDFRRCYENVDSTHGFRYLWRLQGKLCGPGREGCTASDPSRREGLHVDVGAGDAAVE